MARTLSAPDTAAGKKAKCPACGQIMVVPEAVHEAEELGAAAATGLPHRIGPQNPRLASPENWLDQMQGPDARQRPRAGGERTAALSGCAAK